MNSTNLAIQIIPDLTIDDKYGAIINDALKRISSFTENALNNGRVDELFLLKKSGIDRAAATRILRLTGRLSVGFQFEPRGDAADTNFRLFVKKVLAERKGIKFYLTPDVQDIMLQLISLEDRRTLAVFSMLSSSLDVGYRVLTTLYGGQLKRLLEKAASFVTESMVAKLERLQLADSTEQADLWEESVTRPAAPSESRTDERPGSQDNILQVMADDGLYDEINQYVENIVSRTERIREKRRKLEENPNVPRSEIYRQMVQEDLDQLENCYARMHIYLRAFYKNKGKRKSERNTILRQFFAGEIEKITGETGLLEDLLSLNEEEYFKNIDRHKEL